MFNIVDEIKNFDVALLEATIDDVKHNTEVCTGANAGGSFLGGKLWKFYGYMLFDKRNLFAAGMYILHEQLGYFDNIRKRIKIEHGIKGSLTPEQEIKYFLPDETLGVLTESFYQDTHCCCGSIYSLYESGYLLPLLERFLQDILSAQAGNAIYDYPVIPLETLRKYW